MSELLKSRAEAADELGFRLLAYLSAAEKSEGGNVFLSSFSIAIALAMTYNGASGEAREALGALLGLDGLSLEALNEANAAFLAMSDGLDPKVALALANAIWVATGFDLAPEFVERMESQYAGKAASLDFSVPSEAARVINEWVAAQTHDKVQELLSPQDLSADAILVLVNAIYFKGAWTHSFDKGSTSERAFICADGRRKQIPMMARSGDWQYSETDMFQGIVLPFGEGRVGMHVLLPKPEVPFEAFREHLTSERWREWPLAARPTHGRLVLPRFKACYNEDLVEALVALGGEGFRGPGFRGMGVGDLRVGVVAHEAVLEVDEEGAEAAAATAVVLSRGAPSPGFSMIVDRPFFCAIRDRETGVSLFMGWILDPE